MNSILVLNQMVIGSEILLLTLLILVTLGAGRGIDE